MKILFSLNRLTPRG